MRNKLIALLAAACMLITGCSAPTAETSQPSSESSSNTANGGADDAGTDSEQPHYTSLNDPELLQRIEDDVYADLEQRFGNDDYIVEAVTSEYISKEYLEEVAYNSKRNVFFGYTLEELDTQFAGTRYVFTLGENGRTTVEAFESYNDAYYKALSDVAIGTGVILVCLTISVATAGTGTGALSTVNAFFAVSGKTAASVALSSGVIGAATEATIKGIETGDVEKTVEAAALAGADAFKWGAIIGAVTGGISHVMPKTMTGSKIPTYRESEQEALRQIKNGTGQVSYLAGKEVPWGTPGSSRPDVVSPLGNGTKAVLATEVKNYNLSNSGNVNTMIQKLRVEISQRTIDLPKGSKQEIILDARGRGYSKKFMEEVVEHIQSELSDVYPDIPITYWR
ncbi:hypothetical protein H6A11_05320 [Bifidobacterium pullorum subsp. saeculare]|uniref:hypothetical protein n=1 Tax=Bifidobacterium pullorum TaxID=78448 RepID=UPI0019574AAE|nr:hypothetical protein [Bifidobacterium pullorum]MBM6696448.1 hypothetical protein [Bifidobacterium pullorum subsp. saeculare]